VSIGDLRSVKLSITAQLPRRPWDYDRFNAGTGSGGEADVELASREDGSRKHYPTSGSFLWSHAVRLVRPSCRGGDTDDERNSNDQAIRMGATSG
jgi:hypothetical protein